MDSIRALETAFTTLTDQLSSREDEAAKTNAKIRELHTKVVSLERDISSLIPDRESMDECVANVPALLQKIEQDYKTLSPEYILDYTRKTLRAIISADNVKVNREASASPFTPPSASSTSTEVAPKQILAKTAKLTEIFKKVIENMNVNPYFILKLLNFRGVYMTGGAVLKTLLNQEFDDPRLWIDVVVLGMSDFFTVQNFIETSGYVCIASTTETTKVVPENWIRKTFRLREDTSPLPKPDLIVYFNAKNVSLQEATFMLPFQFSHNFYDGTNFFVLDTAALQSKTHTSEKPLTETFAYEKAEYRFEAFAYGKAGFMFGVAARKHSPFRYNCYTETPFEDFQAVLNAKVRGL